MDKVMTVGETFILINWADVFRHFLFQVKFSCSQFLMAKILFTEYSGTFVQQHFQLCVLFCKNKHYFRFYFCINIQSPLHSKFKLIEHLQIPIHALLPPFFSPQYFFLYIGSYQAMVSSFSQVLQLESNLNLTTNCDVFPL